MDGYSKDLIKVDFPDPETPVIQTSLLRGKSSVRFFKLFCLAPERVMRFFPLRLFCGTGISFIPSKYLAVKLSFALMSAL